MKLDFGAPGRIVFSEKFACPVSGFTIAEIEPRLFSFNAPQGACPACDGLGEKLLFDPQLVVPNEALSLKRGAVVPQIETAPRLQDTTTPPPGLAERVPSHAGRTTSTVQSGVRTTSIVRAMGHGGGWRRPPPGSGR